MCSRLSIRYNLEITIYNSMGYYTIYEYDVDNYFDNNTGNNAILPIEAKN